jgi:hypothetical protein
VAGCRDTLSILGSCIPPFSRPNPEAWFVYEETKRQTSDCKTWAIQFCKDFSFTSKYPELELALQKIQELLFTTNSNKRSKFLVCTKHIQGLQNKCHLPSNGNPIECYQIGKHSESLDKLEELRNLAVKEIEGNR